jgi:TetR/AcrR family transcriptional regulator, cholesterol catabolism regulator
MFGELKMMDSKDNLIKAALTLMEKKGYQGTSIQDIVNLAGLTKGSFYYYFESKDDLLFLIHDQFIEYELRKATELLENKELKSSEKIRQLITFTWEAIENFRENVTIFFQEMKYINDEKFKVIKEKRDKFENCYVQILEDGIRNGEFSEEMNKRITAFSIIGMISWGLNWYKEDRSLSVQEIANIQADLILNGLTQKNEK